MKKVIIFIGIVLATFLLSAQEKHISGFYNNNLTFYPDTTYIIDYHTRIGSDATLKILASTKVLFASGASLVINGNLDIVGKPNKMVIMKSKDMDFQGIGLLLSGYKGTYINIEFCKMTDLLIPLTFSDGWYRESVIIQNNIFTNISAQPGVKIGSLSQIYSGASCVFDFSQNNFTNNNATIYIEPLEDDVMQLNFSNNLLSSNVLIGKDISNPMNATFSGYFDQRDRMNIISFIDNTIVNNVMLSGVRDNDVHQLNIGISGSGESFEISRNFLGEKSNSDASLIHFFQNDKLPLILLTNLLDTPSEKTHAHVWKVRFKTTENWTDMLNYWQFPNVNSNEISFELYYNREVSIPPNFTIPFKYYNNQKNEISVIEFTPYNVSYTSNVLSFQLQKTSKLKNIDNGAFIFPIATDSDGFNSPELTLGNLQKVILFEHGLLDSYQQKEEEKKKVINPDKPQVVESKKVKKNKEISIGFLLGASLYSGDLNSSLSQNNHSYFGMSVNQQLSDEMSLRLEIASTRISGNSDDFKNFSFSSEIAEFNLLATYKLNQFSFFNISPFIFLGASYIHHQPMSNYNNFTYDLQTLSTEGQEEPYALNLFAIPVGFGFQSRISKKLTIGIQARFRKVFSDYLDDVSGAYANYDDILSNSGEVAAYFSDPSRAAYDYQKNETRGNPFDKDTYSTILISISKTIK
ncbi:MAG: hypothetical protein H8E84_00685 [Flavobacteriales bacterium]|nr:hypothetical protein [Flavobacteriales bacterium]